MRYSLKGCRVPLSNNFRKLPNTSWEIPMHDGTWRALRSPVTVLLFVLWFENLWHMCDPIWSGLLSHYLSFLHPYWCDTSDMYCKWNMQRLLPILLCWDLSRILNCWYEIYIMKMQRKRDKIQKEICQMNNLSIIRRLTSKKPGRRKG